MCAPPPQAVALQAGEMLPVPVLQTIGAFLYPSEEAICARVCRSWYTAITAHDRWRDLTDAVYWSPALVRALCVCV